MFKANGWFLCLSVYSPAALLDKAGTSCRGSLAVRQSVRGEEEADGKTQLCMDEKLVWLHILADLLTLITHSPSAASDPNFSLPRGFFLLPSSIWAVCLTFHGLGQHLYMLLTGRQAQRPYIRSAGVDAVMFLCFLPLCIHITVSSASTSSPFISQMCQQALGLHTVCGNPPACRKAQILAFRLTCVSCTMEGVEVGQKGAVSACILLAQALLEKPAVIFKWISFCLLALFFFFSFGCLAPLSWFTAFAHVALERGVLKAFCFQKEKELAGVHISLLKLCRVKSPGGKRGDIREQRAGGDTCQKENSKEERVTLELLTSRPKWGFRGTFSVCCWDII